MPNDFFKQNKDSILVNVPIMEVYLPFEYTTVTLPGTSQNYYEVVGENVRFYAVANFKVFKTEKEHAEKIEEVLTYPIGIPTMLLSHPSETSVKEMRFNKHYPYEKMVVLTYRQGDAFVVNTNVVKSADNVSGLMSRFEGGKLTNIPPAMTDEVIEVGQIINNMKLKLPSEMIEAFTAERYRDPANPAQKIRFSKASDAVQSNDVVSYNMREEAMQSTTYQGISFEDINSALITATNRKNKGIKDEATVMEKIIRGEKITEDD